jgi:hypothetical protein
MATSLDNIDEDLLFYKELVKYAYTDMPKVVDDYIIKNMITSGVVQIETLFEHAISIEGNLERKPTLGMDFADGSDAKKVTSSFRNNDTKRGSWTNSYSIRGIKNKKGILRVMGFNRIKSIIQNETVFDYYAIPYEAYSHLNYDSLDITLDRVSGYFDRSNPPKAGVHLYGNHTGKFLKFKVNTFTEMAQAV